jgi:hypothetical protein
MAQNARGTLRIVGIREDGDTVINRAFGFSADLITEQEANSMVSQLIEANVRRSGNAARSAWENRRSELRSTIPQARKVVSDLRVTQDHAIWLRLVAETDRQRWLKLDGAGRPVGTIELPQSATGILGASGERVFTAMVDALGVPSLVQYRIMP